MLLFDVVFVIEYAQKTLDKVAFLKLTAIVFSFPNNCGHC